MSIKQRLAFGFGAVLAVFAIAALILSREMASDRRMTERIADDFSTHVAAAHTLASAAEIAATSLHGYALTGEQDLLEAYKRSAARRQAALREIRGTSGLSDASMIADLSGAVSTAALEERRVIALCAANRRDEARRCCQDAVLPAADTAISSALRLASVGSDRIQAATLQVRASEARLNGVFRLTLIAAFALALAFIFATVRSVSHPARSIARAARALANGNYERALRLAPHSDAGMGEDTRDELTLIAVAFREMTAALKKREEALTATNASLSLERTELEQYATRMEDSYRKQRSIAHTLQDAFRPSVEPRIGDFEIAHEYIPAQSEAQVGGDFYDVITLGDGVLGIVIGDVSGKGIGATMHTAMARYMLRGIASEESDPASVLSRLNNTITQTVQCEVFITMFYGILDTRERRLRYANAGHELPLLLKGDSGKCLPLETTGHPMGIFPSVEYGLKEMQLDEGDSLVLYTDGITEARQGKEFFGQDALHASLSEARGLSAEGMIEQVLGHVADFAGGPLQDDAAMVVIKSAQQ